MSESWRLFIANELPRELLDELVGIQSDLMAALPDRAVRWVRPEGIHLTLKFLGNVPVGQIEDIQAGLALAVEGYAPFNLNAVGLGCFPNTRRPNVIWVGIEGDTRALKALWNSVEQAIAPLGYPTEGRSFNPHLTLGRTDRRAAPGELAQVGQHVEGADVGWLASWDVAGLSLIRSQLQAGGAIYTTLAHYPLETTG